MNEKNQKVIGVVENMSFLPQPDGSRLEIFGAGGGDYGKTDTAHFGGGAGAGVKVDPVAFLVVKDGLTRVMPVAIPAAATVDRVLDLVPEVLDRVQNFVDKKREEKDIY